MVYDAVRESVEAIGPWMPWCHPAYSLADSCAWIEAQVGALERGEAYEFAIESAAGEYLGACGLNQIDMVNRRANLGYWVRTAATGKGVATAAVRRLRDWGFQNTELVRLEMLIAEGNLASRRVAEKSGAHFEGKLRSRMLLHGVTHDGMLFSFVR